MKPLVSIIVPSRNEEKFIGKCLDSIIQQDYPKDKMEILVVDGGSEDKTREIVRSYYQKYSFIKLLDNPKKIFAAANNVGIKNAKGNFVIFLGAHATYSKNYVEECIKYLLENKSADSVGGVTKSLPTKNTLIAKAIVLSMVGRFGKGREEPRESKEADTVFGACYRREVFNKIGFFNENLQRSSDMDFNLRLTRAGGKIYLIPNATSFYYPKANLKDFFLHNFEDGIWAVYPLKFVKMPFRLRHYIPFIFVLSLLGTGILGIFFPAFLRLFLFIIGLYFLVSIYFSIKISLKEKDFKLVFLSPVVFAARHIGYGLGSILGLIKLLF